MKIAHAVIVSTILGIGVVVGIGIHGHFFRFATANGGDGIVYVIDRRTGDVSLISGSVRQRVDDAAEKQKEPDPFEEAHGRVWTAQMDLFFDLKRSSDPYEVIDWRVYRSTDQVFFATLRVVLNGEHLESPFEVNLATRSYRPVVKDSPLWESWKAAREKGEYRTMPLHK